MDTHFSDGWTRAQMEEFAEESGWDAELQALPIFDFLFCNFASVVRTEGKPGTPDAAISAGDMVELVSDQGFDRFVFSILLSVPDKHLILETWLAMLNDTISHPTQNS
jgi:hypothetical protein